MFTFLKKHNVFKVKCEATALAPDEIHIHVLQSVCY